MSKGYALVTGSAKRLGREILLGLAREGYDLWLHYHRSEVEAKAVKAEVEAMGRTCRLAQHDLSDLEGIESWMYGIIRTTPELRLVVNSASSYEAGGLAEVNPRLFRESMDTNVGAPLFIAQSFARRVHEGHMINIVDNKVAFRQPAYMAYLLSKLALQELTRLLALEMAPYIRVNGICPGVVMPGSTRSPAYVDWRIEGIPLRKQGKACDIVEAVSFLDRSLFMTGQVLTVDGGEGLTNEGRHALNYNKE